MSQSGSFKFIHFLICTKKPFKIYLKDYRAVRPQLKYDYYRFIFTYCDVFIIFLHVSHILVDNN